MPLIHRAIALIALILLFVTILHVLGSRDTVFPSLFSDTAGIPQSPRSQQNLSISTSTLVETSIPGSEVVTGFALLDRLYLRNGTFFIVTANQSAFPPRRNIISPGLDMGAGHDLEPTDKELRFITPEEAEIVLGPTAIRIDGLSVVVYDTEQFMRHFYHWWGEILLGSWRVYSALFSTVSSPPPLPARFILPFIYNNEWRDAAGLNAPLTRACFPSTTIEKIDYWEDLARLDRTVVFDRAMIVSRETSGRHPLSSKWFKMISPAMGVKPVPEFFEPLRRTAIRNLLGYIPILNEQGAVTGIVTPSGDAILNDDVPSDLPIVTYISRQGGARRLSDSDHEGLVQALRDLEQERVCEVNVVRMETMSVKEQVAVAARSTILVGVHGNGMTHEIWMPPSSRSTVIEIFTPNGYIFDYEILARNLGHKHYAVWNDTLTSFPKDTYHEGVSYAEDFHGVSIPVHGPSVAQVIRKRLASSSLWGG